MSVMKKDKGIIIPAVTPLKENCSLDEAAVEKMFANFHQHQVYPFIIGTTGESASLTNQVKLDYLKAAAKHKHTETVLYAGISSNVLSESIEFAKACADNGVDVVATTLPTYYALTESQMKQYFEQLADAIPLPLIIYNIPATTHMSIPLQLIDELSHHENIVGTKDSERSDERLNESLQLWKDRKDFSHFLGWAAKSNVALMNGGDGLIPSTGNLIPSIYNEMQKAAIANDIDQVSNMQRLSDLFGNLYQAGRTLGESLWALKVLMNEAGLCQPFVMPPLQPKSAEEEKQLINDLKTLLEKENIRL
jgi:dihydrodipicolinate synthase/N-acetylneuraminate lyase